jgi:plasmid stabilization system protein ParE
MAFRVNLTARAHRDLAAIYEYIQAGSSVQAFRWFNRLEKAILSLEKHPRRGTVAREDSRLRQILYGNKPHVYRIIYSIRERSRVVSVLHIRHGARQDFQK